MDFKNLVRKMHACETMGGENYICTDKNGTLTKNEMNVFSILTSKGQIELKETIEDNEEEALDKNKNIKNELKIREQNDIYFKDNNHWDKLPIAVALNVHPVLIVIILAIVLFKIKVK